MTNSKQQALIHCGREYIFEANLGSDLIHPKWQDTLNDYAQLIKEMVGGNVRFKCRSYRKESSNYLSLILEGDQAICVIDFIESCTINIPKLTSCFEQKPDKSWHSTWHLLDSPDMFYVACFLAEFLNADLHQDKLDQGKTEYQVEFLMIQRVEQKRITDILGEN